MKNLRGLKIWFSFLILLLTGFTSQVSAQHNPNDQVKSAFWDIVGNVKFHFVQDTVLIPRYTKKIKAYENKSYELEGYLVPIDEGWKQKRFMLSTLPINQCFYCGKNGVPSMVLVEMKTPVKFTYQTIKIKGTLKLNKGNAMTNPPICLVNAEKV